MQTRDPGGHLIGVWDVSLTRDDGPSEGWLFTEAEDAVAFCNAANEEPGQEATYTFRPISYSLYDDLLRLARVEAHRARELRV